MKNTFPSLMVTLVSLIFLFAPGLSCQVDSVSINSEIDAIFEKYNSKTGPGCAVSVIHKGQLVFTKGYGSANLEYDIDISQSTVFDIASVSKQFTGYAISTLLKTL